MTSSSGSDDVVLGGSPGDLVGVTSGTSDPYAPVPVLGVAAIAVP